MVCRANTRQTVCGSYRDETLLVASDNSKSRSSYLFTDFNGKTNCKHIGLLRHDVAKYTGSWQEYICYYVTQVTHFAPNSRSLLYTCLPLSILSGHSLTLEIFLLFF